jgi:hypothetical protein
MLSQKNNNDEPSNLSLLHESHSSPSSSQMRPLLTRFGLNFHVVEQYFLRRRPNRFHFVERGPYFKIVTGVFHSVNVLTPVISIRMGFLPRNPLSGLLTCFNLCFGQEQYILQLAVLFCFCPFPLYKFHCHRWRPEEMMFCEVLILMFFGRNLV